MEKRFSSVAVSPASENWEILTKRPNELYSRPDDIRSPFARDYTRVLHSLAYRRLKHKTQVFLNAAGNDHICTRIEHVQHVDSVSNTIARELGLNEELVRAIALAHDLGHAPFGHGGEKIISALTEKYLGEKFWHEQNGVYFVDKLELLEDNEMRLRNLNLTYAVRDGIISHCGEMDKNALRPRTEFFDLREFRSAGKYEASTWEGCVVKLSDKIAYLGRDIEDAGRLGYFNDAQRKMLQDMARIHNSNAINTTVIMHNMIIDLCQNSSPEGGMRLSEELSQQMNEIKEFNYRNIYGSPRMSAARKYSELVINELFEALLGFWRIEGGEKVFAGLLSSEGSQKQFVKDFAHWLAQYCSQDFGSFPELKSIADRCSNEKVYGDLTQEKQYIRAVIDFIAGMTDVYAMNSFNELLQC